MELERKHLRLPADVRVFIEAESAEAGRSDSVVTSCRTLDVSLSGMRLTLDHELPVGAFLHLGVEAPRSDWAGHTLFLVGVVRWCCPQASEDGPWLAGLELQPARDSDIETWVQLVSSLDG